MSTPFLAPVSMLSSKGSGGAIAAAVIGLVLMLALASRRDPTARSEPFLRTV
jgi:hypothetical protein